MLEIVNRLLITACSNQLAEIAKTVKQANTGNMYILVTGFFQVVAGQYAQPSRINLQGVVETIFHAEIGNMRLTCVGLFGHIICKPVVDAVQLIDIILIATDFDELVVFYLFKQNGWVLVAFQPYFRINALEQFLCFIVPAPPKIFGKLSKFVQGLGEL